MKYRFSIANKLSTGFGVLIILIVIVISVTTTFVNRGIGILSESIEENARVTNIYDPSERQIKLLRDNVAESKRLIIQWVNAQTSEQDPDKIRLRKIINESFPKVKDSLNALSRKWKDSTEIQILRSTFNDIDELTEKYLEIMNYLPDFESYSDDMVMFMVNPMIQPGFEVDRLSGKILFNLDDLIQRHAKRAENARAAMNKSFNKTSDSFNKLLKLVIALGITLILLGVIIAYFTARSIVKPVKKLRNMLISLGKGVFPATKMKISNDEIGDMSEAMNQLVDSMRRTTDFANELGQSNFNYFYQPLSDEDSLGHALLKMRDELAENERELELKVQERTEEVVSQRDEIEMQREKLEELYKNVTDSIRYAKRLQDSILPPSERIVQLLPESFVLFKPKDIVSGDFYWLEEKDDQVLFAAVDCTGHGVPGAFMSLVGANALNQTVKQFGKSDPAEILDNLNRLSSEMLHKGSESNDVRDGMDLTLCSYNKKNGEFFYSGANNPLYLIRKGKLYQYNPDKYAIGSFEPGSLHYTTHKVPVQKGDIIYIFSDGYADQFGGDPNKYPEGKKFLYKNFRNLLIDIHALSMAEQKRVLDETIIEWMAGREQIDDILIMGVRF